VVAPHPLTMTDEEFLAHLQQLVTEWLQEPLRAPFHRFLRDRHPERSRFVQKRLTSAQRAGYAQVADLIRLGRGHATANPAPLLAVLQEWTPPPAPAHDPDDE
jgi:hypothetical protein